ncbi:MAG: hypothetical protein CM1200mP41_36580 [Gammaproteobacteria bacterium]|nr:MAG: hypothetical protein CM1200mP41_36580 [Gammaproteobacteria bacterium]
MNTKHFAMLLLVPLSTVALTPANGAEESPPPRPPSLNVSDRGPLVFYWLPGVNRGHGWGQRRQARGCHGTGHGQRYHREELRKMRPANTPSRAQCKVVSAEAEAGPSEDEEGDHRIDVMSTWVMECQKPALLKYLDISLFKAMPAVNVIEAYYFSDTAQVYKKLTPASKRLSW